MAAFAGRLAKIPRNDRLEVLKVGAAALRVFSGDSPSPSSKPASITDRALVVLGYLRTIAGDRIDTPISAAQVSIAAVCGKTQTQTRRALAELARFEAITWDPRGSIFILLPGSLLHARTVRTHGAHGHGACAPCATPTVRTGDAPASEERAPAGMAGAPCVLPPPPKNQEKSLVQESGGEIRGHGAPACEESQPELPFPPPSASGPELAKVATLAMELGGDVYWGVFVDRMATIGYPAEWIRSAVEKGAALNRLRPEYLHGILKGYQRDGGPPKAAQQTAPPTIRKPPTLEAPRQSPEARQRTIDYLNSRINRKGGRP